MPKLVIEVEVNDVLNDDEIVLGKIRDAVVAVVGLCDFGLETFCTSRIEKETT